MDVDHESGSEPVRYIRSRIANACDGCKTRKVKCDGKLPCGFCVARQRAHTCRYSPQKRRRQSQLQKLPKGGSLRSPSPMETPGSMASRRVSSVNASSPAMRSERQASALHQSQELSVAEDETEVQREARLLCDAHGKLTFIGDCAPLSFFQSVRRLVTNRIGQNAFAPQTSRFSVLENAPARQTKRSLRDSRVPHVRPADVTPAVATYLSTTASLVDLFDNSKLLDDLVIWANLAQKPDNVTTIIHFLVLAIGLQADSDALSQQYFEYARDLAYTDLSDSLGVETVQAFILVTVYMLCSCQINGAFLFFGIAARAAYSIGLHRTEVNARFGQEIHRQRDRLWKSLRVLDLFLSSSLGRPPSTSDVDCTVPYRAVDADGNEVFDLLNASVQILVILECIILEIYSRKKISMRLTEGISLQLREWSGRWLGSLKDMIAQPAGRNEAQVTGACQVLSSYYYAVMLVSRPFLILMVDPVLDLIERGILRGKAPLLVSWLFAASLVLGVGLLGGFSRILEKYTRMSIQAMDHLAQNDAHARQYSLIAQSLLTTALEHLERQDLQDRLRRTENSSHLFGLTPDTAPDVNDGDGRASVLQSQSLAGMGEMDSIFLGLSEPMLHTPDTTYWDGIVGNDSDPNSALNLFPLLETGGGIDLAHWL
ncbi:hypothetical protein TRIATDRAFT_214226 [Trichoderma atroviride IMI 206040]|uniref:Zn(2)-C6 fungal-type domain-containing protein n=1 Tax=Hypocrea atroviridis (strain ATCC 20476 / IMI 206040) TaxID=452589 RepID=G9NK81_HYPAI|nr:uncharacterized protein TRIATDRAFT_214226 [Trichoderma atroviride IMI 206040]EHK49300.1 hypothetical protein TRIATDRAFT_214226 [Trichoderma atroviride IMI 206040]